MKVTAAQIASKPLDGVPDEIVYIPEGMSQIRATKDGKPALVNVSVMPENGEQIAARLQSQLEARQSANVRPWIDFDHKEGKSAGNPVSFRYEKGKGIIMAMDWSESGKAAIKGKDFSYFSPTFLLAADGTPDGIDSTGPIGGLVNEPAFRDIPRIAAKHAAQADNPQHPIIMSEKILAALSIDAAHKDAESKAITEIARIQAAAAQLDAVTKERDELKSKIEAAETAAAEQRKERAETLIQAALADGRLSEKADESLISDFRAKIEAGDSFAEKALAALKPAVNPGESIVKAGHAHQGGDMEGRREAALVKAGQALGESASFHAKFTKAQEIDPAAFND